jgi:glycine reductase
MAVELERAGVPVAFVSAIPAIPLSLGVARVVLGVAIPYVLGDPRLSPERERSLRRALVETVIRSLEQPVSEPTLFRTSRT